MGVSELWTWIDTYYIWVLFLWMILYAVGKNIGEKAVRQAEAGQHLGAEILFRHFLFLSLVVYAAALIFLTMVRHPYPEMKYELSFLWEYRYALAGNRFLMREIRDNIFLFVPLGILLSEGLYRSGHKASGWRVVALGFVVSLTVEVIQLVFKLGLFEFDDMFNNTIGALAGHLFYVAVSARVMSFSEINNVGSTAAAAIDSGEVDGHGNG